MVTNNCQVRSKCICFISPLFNFAIFKKGSQTWPLNLKYICNGKNLLVHSILLCSDLDIFVATAFKQTYLFPI